MAQTRGRPIIWGNTEGAYLLRLIKEQGELETQELAALLNTSPESIRRWQRGQVEVKGTALSTIRALVVQKKVDFNNLRMLAEFNKMNPDPMPPEKAIAELAALKKKLRD
ncbi:DeoR family transcriptional regulator [Ferrimonas marina]|uniref:DeoR-like helix-turn-helix domain-containing protein n=1 Tax=Ferrimonas marina TaxID=299255 RepID=A0A1M5YU45_9GAMM|nr:DeoR family transcriptional regulator [Ferrimonas marina]SHI15627.1 DeoR-like helix-turn-helix domain-containing protein [Ferrimonas marina]